MHIARGFGRRAVVAAVIAMMAASLASAPPAAAARDPRTWTTRQLAAQVVFACADSRATDTQRAMARAGVGGIVLLGSSPPSDLRQRLASVGKAARGPRPMIASDEEGGTVQRLAPLLGRLPSAETMGWWSTAALRARSRSYGRGMAALGVRMSLAPVADLRVPGSYIDQLGRSFSSDPQQAGRAVRAWSAGLRDARVAPVVKHWPGHGHAVDTHQFAATVPPLWRLRTADLIPFNQALAAGAPVVMVGHLQAAGLTPRGVPATQSKRAISYLRRTAGPNAVIVTDSLSMAAASSARGLSQAGAVVAALRAGVDWAMVCSADTGSVITAVQRAIADGRLPRRQVERSVARILEVKRVYRG